MVNKTFIRKKKMDSVRKDFKLQKMSLIDNKHEGSKKNDVKTEENIFVDKKNKDSQEKDKKNIKLNKLKKKRLIIRNLSFKVTEEDLKKIFSEFGKVLEVVIPLKEDGKKRGFAFVQFEETKSLIKSMKALNYKPICGRPVAIDYAMDKSSYQQKVQNIVSSYDCPIKEEPEIEIKTEIKSESEESEQENDCVKSDSEESNDEKRANKFLKEFGVGDEIDQDLDDEASSNESDDQEDDASSDDSEEPEVVEKSDREKNQKHPKNISNDVSQGKTVFIRNLSFSTAEEDLQEIMEEYGECEYCLICFDKLTEHPKGTAFVKFKDKNSAEKLINEAEKDPGIILDGRKLNCNYAISQKELPHKDDVKKPKDKRNLRYLKYSLIMSNSKEAEGVSQTDMAKRQQLERFKKERLKITNFCVSDKRLIIHNLPEKFTDIELRKLFKKASGKGAVITEARIMRDFKKVNSTGFPVSKGFGFVSFSQHEDALKALMELNNNPNIFSPHKRPIVEFSVENKVALLSKERRKEKNIMRSKKRTQEKNERRANAVESNKTEINSKENSSKSSKRKRKRKEKNPQRDKVVPIQKDETDVKQISESPKKRNKRRKRTKSNVKFTNETVKSPNQSENETNSKSKHKKIESKQEKRKKLLETNKRSRESISSLADKYKKKLLNKLS